MRLPCRVISAAHVGSGRRLVRMRSAPIVYVRIHGAAQGCDSKAETLIDGAARVASALGYQSEGPHLCPVHLRLITAGVSFVATCSNG
jgi:hypothetical protein